MGDIILLDEHTINKIAAGEVVDRPSSIVKELLENSIDAGADKITVEIKNGGIKYIKITDNGKGFKRDDIEMAFERHATSKIRKEEDLSKILSMGFRGEALASIAAISKVRLVTRTDSDKIGTEVNVESGKMLNISEVASLKGTKIEIRDVFYNVPARFKFLKKDYTEAGYIEDSVIRLALSNPGITFKYINNSKDILSMPGNSNLQETIYNIFGKEIFDNLIEVEYEHGSIKVKGVIGMPNISRSTRAHQFTYINKRYIKNKTITSAIDKAFSEKLAINKFAFAVLNITMNPASIDVNVHPSKLEVKFENENNVFECVYYGIKTALEKQSKKDSPFSNIMQNKIESSTFVNQLDNKQAITDTLNVFNNLKDNIRMEVGEIKGETKKYSFDKIEEQNEEYITNKPESLEEKVYNEQVEIINVVNENLSIDDKTAYEKQAYRYIGQAFGTYIIIQIEEKIYIIDQHAAHERLIFEQVKENYYSKEKQSQMLLIPILIELTPKEKNLVGENFDLFEKSGFIIEDFMDNTIKISGVPSLGYDIDFSDMLKDIIDELLGANKTNSAQKEFRFLATVACKAAVKANMKLSEEEQINLISNMVKLENPFTCPHGRPTAYEISKHDIEKRFLRK